MGRIVDVYGEPIDLGTLKQEIATPELAGVRSVWALHVANGLTPGALAELLRESVDGDIERYLALAEDIEERDLHYLGVLGSRKRSLSGLDITVEAATDEAAEVDMADACRELLQDPIAEDLVEDMQDALGKSFSVVETLWDTSEKQWRPKGFEHRDPRWFTFDRLSRRELRLRDMAAPIDGIKLAPFKFIEHRPRIKSGLPIRNGFARIAAFAWICKSYALKDWMAYAEVFGMPLRLGRYPATASPSDVSTLASAVANIGTDAAAVIPESMKIEFVEAATGQGGADVFEKLCVYIDKQISKAVQGQTMTTDDGSSLAQANVHNDIRLDILEADAKSVAGSLNRHLIKPFIDLNYGPQKRYPRVVINVPKPEDIKGLVDAVDKLTRRGMKVEQSWIRDKLGIPDPERDAELLNLGESATPKPEEDPPKPKPGKPALNSQQSPPATPEQLLDQTLAEGLADWERQLNPMVDAIEALAAECADEAEFLRRLPELGSRIDTGLLQQALATATFKARGIGDTRNPSV